MYKTTVMAVIVLFLFFLFGCGTELDVVAPEDVEDRGRFSCPSLLRHL